MAIASIEHDKIFVMAGKVTQKSHCKDKKISVELTHHLFYGDIGVTLSFLYGVITMNLFTGRQARPQASSLKPQASSLKPQASSLKPQASSLKPQAK